MSFSSHTKIKCEFRIRKYVILIEILFTKIIVKDKLQYINKKSKNKKKCY